MQIIFLMVALKQLLVKSQFICLTVTLKTLLVRAYTGISLPSILDGMQPLLDGWRAKLSTLSSFCFSVCQHRRTWSVERTKANEHPLWIGVRNLRTTFPFFPTFFHCPAYSGIRTGDLMPRNHTLYRTDAASAAEHPLFWFFQHHEFVSMVTTSLQAQTADATIRIFKFVKNTIIFFLVMLYSELFIRKI